MTRVRGFLFGFLLTAPVTLYALPTTVAWTASRCPAGDAILSATASNGLETRTATTALTFPVTTASVTFQDLPSGTWLVTPSVAHSDGTAYGGNVEVVTVAGQQTPTTSPCQHVTSGTDLMGHAWSLTPSGVVMRDGMYALPRDTAQPGAVASAMSFDQGVVHVRDSRDGKWYRRDETTRQFSPASEPICGGAPVPPAPTPTVALKACTMTLTAPRPPSIGGSGWSVQFFEGQTALSALATDVADVTLSARPYLVVAVWTKTGEPTQRSLPVSVECATK